MEISGEHPAHSCDVAYTAVLVAAPRVALRKTSPPEMVAESERAGACTASKRLGPAKSSKSILWFCAKRGMAKRKTAAMHRAGRTRVSIVNSLIEAFHGGFVDFDSNIAPDNTLSIRPRQSECAAPSKMQKSVASVRQSSIRVRAILSDAAPRISRPPIRRTRHPACNSDS